MRGLIASQNSGSGRQDFVGFSHRARSLGARCLGLRVQGLLELGLRVKGLEVIGFIGVGS